MSECPFLEFMVVGAEAKSERSFVDWICDVYFVLYSIILCKDGAKRKLNRKEVTYHVVIGLLTGSRGYLVKPNVSVNEKLEHLGSVMMGSRG